MTKTIWITGASSGIGEHVARRLAARGDTVVASARSEDDLNALRDDLSECKGRLVPFPLDVTDRDACLKAGREIEAEIGTVDCAIFNAGTYKPDTGEDFDAENMRRHIELNLFGMVHGMEAVLPAMRERRGGHLVFVSSVAGYRGLPRSISYSASKAAVITMAESLKIELKPFDIKVQVVNPGFVKTPLTDKNDFKMPMLMPVEDAADAFVKGIDGDSFEITFPKPFTFIMNRLRCLPNWAYFKLVDQIEL